MEWYSIGVCQTQRTETRDSKFINVNKCCEVGGGYVNIHVEFPPMVLVENLGAVL